MHLDEEQRSIPDMDLQPPKVEIQNGKPVLHKDDVSEREGAQGWISNIVRRGKGESSGKYSSVAQADDDR